MNGGGWMGGWMDADCERYETCMVFVLLCAPSLHCQLWNALRGKGDGSYYNSGYNSSTAPFAPKMNCAPCSGTCMDDFIDVLNGTNYY